MKKKLSKKEAREKINDFFRQDEKLDPKYTKKIKRLAMLYNIKLGQYRKKFCKKCYTDLRKTRGKVNNGYKTIICEKCGTKGRWKVG